MSIYKKILLCYDATLEGRKALHQGAELAVQFNTETHLLSVLDLHSRIGQSAGLVFDVVCDQFEQDAKSILSDGVEQLMAEWGLDVQGHYAFGNPIDVIARYANRLQVDLIVVGHRCRKNLSRWWSGSGHAPLLDRVSCSILVACAGSASDR
ncbi:universal stress protein [Paraburkholderia susongensis]|uniref:Nucleotide-binding universal stress protein, UspA family n=1 Tax=Paraburkholderia susongensis TaxID=1515439 RepID=A0A1X7M290_9BURK|nr:universal stress protein [Paraburkholderia susongensis]SMG59622.1 Nucleotide-binding universal stress protein, UspA family [Paraburkholderia susongensis]